MRRYYCPFCETNLQLHTTRSDGLRVCVKCGDELVKVPILKITQVVGLIGASAFLLPLFLMMLLLLKELNNEKENNSSESIAFHFNIDDGK